MLFFSVPAGKDRFSLEDTVCAGAIARILLDSSLFYNECDSVHAVK